MNLFTTLFVLSIPYAVLGDLSYTVDYTDCYGSDDGQTFNDTFTSTDLETALMPICQAIWRSSPDYERDDDSWPTKLYCHTIRVQGSGTADGNVITCDGTVSYTVGDSSKGGLLYKYMEIRDSCVIS